MIKASNVNVAIGRRTIVARASFTAEPGEVTAIIGPNGSGKSTLLNAMSGDLAYTGSLTLHGRELADLSPPEAAVMRAVLPQASTLSFPYTVREVVRLGLINRPAASSLKDLPERALAKVDLEGFAGRFYQELSGGEQQRVQLARVLCQAWSPVEGGAARFLILDEPVSSLDIRHQLLVMHIAREFAGGGGGVITVLHDLNLTAAFADKVLVMKGGRCVASGAPEIVMQDDLLSDVFDCELRVGAVPARGPFILPHAALG